MNIRLKAQIPFYTMPVALLKIGCALHSVCGDTATCDFKKSLGQSGLQTQCNDPQWHTVSHFPQRLLSST